MTCYRILVWAVVDADDIDDAQSKVLDLFEYPAEFEYTVEVEEWSNA